MKWEEVRLCKLHQRRKKDGHWAGQGGKVWATVSCREG